MVDYLSRTCKEMKITLVYTQNKITVLSSAIVKDRPVIRAHKLFKNCDKKVAESIINFYTKPKIDQPDFEIIENFIKFQKPNMIYKIKPPIEIFKYIFNDSTDVNSDNVNKSSEDLVELDIVSMKVKSFKGKTSLKKNKNSINPSDDDVLEVKIIVAPFNT